MNHKRLAALAAAVLGGAVAIAGCGGQNNSSGGSGNGSGSEDQGISGEVRVDGSSTVQPLTAAAGELFKEQEPNVNVSVGTSGTGGGFEKFCAGETDISDASRPIDPEEEKICSDNGIEFTELTVANDALTVVVNPENDWVDCITTEQLSKIWGPESEGKVSTWKDVDGSWPAEKLELYGPGTDSGTFDYFTDEINGEEGASRSDYSASEDDNVLVQGVSGSQSAMGYFGLSYFEENSDKLKALEVDGGDGCVAPSIETAQAGDYTPLGRPLFIYIANKSYAEKEHVKAFVDFYVDNDEEITQLAEFVPLNEEQRGEAQSAVQGLS